MGRGTIARFANFLAPWLAAGLTACGGSAQDVRPHPPDVAAPAVDVSASVAAATAAPTPSARPEAAFPPQGPEEAARGFVEAIAAHDVDAAVKFSGDVVFGRSKFGSYADVIEARLEGKAPDDAWPDSESHLYWATFASKTKSEKILLAVKNWPTKGWYVVGIRNEEDRADVERQLKELEAKAAAAKQPAELTGKLLTKPVKKVLKVSVDGEPPTVGSAVELYRRVDDSVPFLGGSFVLIASAEVTHVSDKTVTLQIVEEKSTMKINGRKLDHFTPGVAIRLKPVSP